MLIAIVWRIITEAFDKEVTVFHKLTHLGLSITLGQDDNINGFGDVLITDPSLIDGQIELVVVADEIVIGADGEAHSFPELAFPSLVAQDDINCHLGERHDD